MFLKQKKFLPHAALKKQRQKARDLPQGPETEQATIPPINFLMLQSKKKIIFFFNMNFLNEFQNKEKK